MRVPPGGCSAKETSRPKTAAGASNRCSAVTGSGPVKAPAIRLALAGLAVVFPTDRTLSALTPRLRTFIHQHPPGTEIGDYVRFVLVLASQDADRILTVTEGLTDAYWTGTARGAPTRARALHLLGQMLTKVPRIRGVPT
ncbi:hypothetical protein [Streptomyces exfoliatus]|uniref:hypothetical protein n=1 Tax=Streptomyces exfoliatus TaxID=1905 RepID=UPI000AC12117|nr:hypothetical protein [Streptomyces exfoliatus]